MRYARSRLAVLVLAGLFGGPAQAGGCPGDLNGDNTVTVDEIIRAVNAALDGCPAPVAAAISDCPGDLNGDGVVTVDEIIVAVHAALNGCPIEPTPTPTEIPSPTPAACPYTFADNTLTLGASCGYAGPFSTIPTCPKDLSALLAGDGSLIAAAMGSDPIITFGGIAHSATSASLVAYFVGDDLTPQPLSGVMELEHNGQTLIIDPATVPAFNIGGADCAFDRYTGTFTRVVSDQLLRAARHPEPRIRALQALIKSQRMR